MHMFHDALVSFAERRVIHMKKEILAGVLALSVIVAGTAGCGKSSGDSKKDAKLDPDNPVSLTVWHYYNGMQQA